MACLVSFQDRLSKARVANDCQLRMKDNTWFSVLNGLPAALSKRQRIRRAEATEVDGAVEEEGEEEEGGAARRAVGADPPPRKATSRSRAMHRLSLLLQARKEKQRIRSRLHRKRKQRLKNEGKRML